MEDKSEVMMIENTQTKLVIKQKKDQGSHLGLIREYLQRKYSLNDTEINAKLIVMKQKKNRLDRIREKNRHKILFSNEDNIIDVKQSSMWLSKGNISPQQEGMLTKLQDRNLYFGGLPNKCPNCRKGSRSVQHLSTHCEGMLSYDYKNRHDEVVRCLHFQFEEIWLEQQ